MADRRGSDLRRIGGARRASRGMARRRRGSPTDRLYASPGWRHHSRQSLQRLARGRQCPCHDRRRRRAEIVGPGGKRLVAVEDVVTGPGSTSLRAGELVTAILLPNRPPRSGNAYLRFTPRTEMDIAVVGAAVCHGHR